MTGEELWYQLAGIIGYGSLLGLISAFWIAFFRKK